MSNEVRGRYSEAESQRSEQRGGVGGEAGHDARADPPPRASPWAFGMVRMEGARCSTGRRSSLESPRPGSGVGRAVRASETAGTSLDAE